MTFNKVILLSLLCYISVASFAQEKSKVSSQTAVKREQVKINRNQKETFKTSSKSNVENTSAKAKDALLLQELYLIEDERHRIEKDNELSASERAKEISLNNSKYIAKKEEFKAYVIGKGFINLPKKEQNYYLSILKSEGNKEEYNKHINLIKN